MRTNPSDCRLENPEEVLMNGRTSGRYEIDVPGRNTPFLSGLPPLLGKPRLAVGLENEPLDIYGYGPYYVSDQAKALFSDVDPEGFEFADCETVDRDGVPVSPYWMMNPLRVFSEFDEFRSSFELYVDRFPDSDPHNSSIVALNDIYMSPDLPASFHSFHLPRYGTDFLVDGMLADAWREANLTGAQLTPLQPPTEEELGAEKEEPDYLSYANSPYWSRRGSNS
jgi:hypothetical protein